MTSQGFNNVIAKFCLKLPAVLNTLPSKKNCHPKAFSQLTIPQLHLKAHSPAWSSSSRACATCHAQRSIPSARRRRSQSFSVSASQKVSCLWPTSHKLPPQVIHNSHLLSLGHGKNEMWFCVDPFVMAFLFPSTGCCCVPSHSSSRPFQLSSDFKMLRQRILSLPSTSRCPLLSLSVTHQDSALLDSPMSLQGGLRMPKKRSRKKHTSNKEFSGARASLLVTKGTTTRSILTTTSINQRAISSLPPWAYCSPRRGSAPSRRDAP